MTPERHQRIGQLYHQALELEPGRRVAFVVEACSGDDSLRREVEALLALDEQAEGFLESPALDLAAAALAREPARSAVGHQIGHYQVLSLLGAGGMGEVYLAEDKRLARKVALKLLPPTFNSDADRVRRFKLEARAAGMLNHPNILTVHDIGTHDGAPYIVSELLEGQELRQQLNEGALVVRKAVDYAVQITRGLAAAHEKGITHRDLKPENLFVTSDGRVKILDFGLAKLKPTRTEAEGEAITLSPPLTEPGVVMGTVGYMAPEQVQGQETDHRSDIFALGVIVYEMLAGRKPFGGGSAAQVLSAILRDEPAGLAEINQDVPAPLELIVRRCLEKRPERRFQTASDLGFALEALSIPSGSRLNTVAAVPAVTESLAGSPVPRHGWLAWILAAIFLLGLLASLPFTLAQLRQTPGKVGTTRFSILPPEKSIFGSIAVSPDGRHLAFIARDAAGKTLLFVRPLDSLAAKPIPDTDDASYPFWSPDSRFIGYFAGGKLKKIDATGGPPSTLCNAQSGRGGAWNQSGVIIFAPDAISGLSRVSASGGEPSLVTTLDSSRRENSHRFPQFLPDGRHFFYFARSEQRENDAIYIGALDQPLAKRIISADSNVAYAPPGYLLFPRAGTLMAQAFDVVSLEVTGDPFRVAEQVRYDGEARNESYFSASDNGVLVYQSGGTARTQLVWFDRNGKRLGSIGPPGDYRFLTLSPDDKRAAVGRFEPGAPDPDIWLLDLQRGIPTRFTFAAGHDNAPVWSPDGSRIVFASNRDGTWALHQKFSSGAGSEEALHKSADLKYPTDWSLDGRFILFYQVSPTTKLDLWVLPLFGDRQPIPFLQTKFNEYGGVFSPDTKWVAYQSNESGINQVYVQDFPSSGGKWQISSDGGERPRFRRDGKELFYLAANGKLMAVEVKPSASSLELGVHKPLFEMHTNENYVVSADGQRFLIRMPIEEPSTAPITVVLNWSSDLKR